MGDASEGTADPLGDAPPLPRRAPDASYKPPELVIDPQNADAELVRDIMRHLEAEFDVHLETTTDHIRVWSVGR